VRYETLNRDAAKSPAAWLVLATVTCLIAIRAGAQVQGGGVSGVVMSTDHELLRSALVGAGVELRIPNGDGRYVFRFGAEQTRGQARRVAPPPCGLVLPGTCLPEPLVDRSQATALRAGGTIRLHGGRQTTLSLGADWVATKFQVDTYGQSNGLVGNADKVLWGPWVGLDADWVPSARLPIGLEAEAGVGAVFPVTHDQILDGYTPFETTIDVRQFRLAVVWRPWAKGQH